MALETGTYIDDLVTTNPLGSDDADTLDGHLRLIKYVIKNTFPSVSGAVTATHTELNYVDGVTSSVQTQLDAKLTSADRASSAEVIAAGGDNLISPGALYDAWTLAADGYINIAGFALQWGTDTFNAGTNATKVITFPLVMNAAYFGTAQIYSTTATNIVHNIAAMDNVSITVKYTASAGVTGRWMVIGQNI